MKTAADILKSKADNTVHTIAPTASVLDAVKRMAEKNIGALLVVEGERVVGIVSERDYARKIVLLGLTFAALAHIPGNILQGNWKILAYVDERASKAQEEAILAVWTGKKGGPVADLAQLVGEVVGVERVPMTFQVEEGKGRLRVGSAVSAEMEPFKGPDGQPTSLHNSVFSTIPGSPAYVGKASSYKADAPALGIKLDLHGHNSVQGSFRFVC
ncbi:MAG: DUF1326 domain-containing protein [Betaproteobacteria bacterium]|nr:MAG: DUF1326 domain-containing protein [Betaproteobacteria bacterium]